MKRANERRNEMKQSLLLLLFSWKRTFLFLCIISFCWVVGASKKQLSPVCYTQLSSSGIPRRTASHPRPPRVNLLLLATPPVSPFGFQSLAVCCGDRLSSELELNNNKSSTYLEYYEGKALPRCSLYIYYCIKI